MFLDVERPRVEVTKETACRDDLCHEFTENVGYNLQKQLRDVDCLGAEVEDLAQDSGEAC